MLTYNGRTFKAIALLVLGVALVLLASSCSSDPSTEERLSSATDRFLDKSGELAGEIDTYEIDGFNIGWDYLDSTGSRVRTSAEIVVAACAGAYETGSSDGAMVELERRMGPTVRYQNDLLVLVFIGTWALDNVCPDYAS